MCDDDDGDDATITIVNVFVVACCSCRLSPVVRVRGRGWYRLDARHAALCAALYTIVRTLTTVIPVSIFSTLNTQLYLCL